MAKTEASLYYGWNLPNTWRFMAFPRKGGALSEETKDTK
jgi:hypothetical protein